MADLKRLIRNRIRFLGAAVLVLLIIFPQGVGLADDGTTDPLETIDFEQNLNAQLPLSLTFRDDQGRSIQLGNYFNKDKPVILVFAYYDCPMLCGLALKDLATHLAEVDFNAGEEYEVVAISIDPTETSEMAAAKKQLHLEIYNRPGTDDGWHFLTGEQEAIDQVTDTAGFRYYYDETIQEYAHPTGVIVLTPQGIISHYFFGIDYPANDLRLALVEAAANQIGTPVDQFFLYCYQYDPTTGRYTVVIQNILRLVAGITVVVIAAALLILIWNEKRGKYNMMTQAEASTQNAPPQQKRELEDK